jgi:hypothetical protein
LLYFGRVLSVRLLRMLAASVDELGKLFAGALEERTQLALFLCIAVLLLPQCCVVLAALLLAVASDH